MSRNEMEQLLKDHYSQHKVTPDQHKKQASLVLIADEAKRGKTLQSLVSFGQFIIGQIRFIRKPVWIIQLGLVLLALLFSIMSENDLMSLILVSMISASTVLVGIPDILRSQSNGVSEIEYSCHFDTKQVALARLILLGISDVLVISCLIILTPQLIDINVFSLFFYACTPYFLTCAGCFFIINHSKKSIIVPLCFGYGILIIFLSFYLFSSAPSVYMASSIWLWGIVFLVSLVITAIQLKTYLERLSNGIDHLQNVETL